MTLLQKEAKILPDLLSIGIFEFQHRGGLLMLYDIEHFDKEDGYAYDTYANLLYKVGKKREALEWEEKAVKMVPDNNEIKENFEKMKKGEPTW